MNNKHNKLQNIFLGLMIVAGIVLCALLLASGGNDKSEGTDTKKASSNQQSSTPAIINAPTAATDMQTKLAVVTGVNEQAATISFRVFGDGQNLYFHLEKAAYIYTAFDNAMTLSQLSMGDVAYITYEAVSGTLTEVHLTNDVTKHTRVSGISINTAYRMLTFYNTNYEYSSDVVVVSGGELITPEQLSSKDLMTVYEMDGKVVSVVVNQGHGYITLTGVDLFLGGYVDIGGEIIKTIEKDMMILVTEGTYKVSVSHNGYYGCKTVTVEQDKVSVVDFSEIVADTVETGNVFFNINAEGAKLYLNGEETDYSQGIITLPTGEYSVRVSADGYDNYVDKITIIADYQKININMTAQEDESDASQTESSTQQTESESATSSTGVTSQYETATKVSTTNRVYIDGPSGAMIYFDGTYLGTAPLDFAMVTGEHTFIVLSGSEVNSYTVNLVEGADDVRYDFSPKSE